jgi:LmbE family N-acetylglucosaminyl deacetylase
MTKKTIMAIGCHCDDIENNTAGTLLKYLDQGYKIVYIIASNNMTGCDERDRELGDIDWPGTARPMPPKEGFEVRHAEAMAAAACFNTEPIFFDFPQGHYHKDGVFKSVMFKFGVDMPEGFDNDLPCVINVSEFKEHVNRLADIIVKEDPEFIFTHTMDYNPEHNGTALFALNAFTEAHKRGARGTLLAWASQQRFEFRMAPDVIVDISDYMDRKLEIQKLHVSQMMQNWDERWHATARFWGEWSYNCKKYGEAFKVLKVGKLF